MISFHCPRRVVPKVSRPAVAKLFFSSKSENKRKDDRVDLLQNVFPALFEKKIKKTVSP